MTIYPIVNSQVTISPSVCLACVCVCANVGKRSHTAVSLSHEIVLVNLERVNLKLDTDVHSNTLCRVVGLNTSNPLHAKESLCVPVEEAFVHKLSPGARILSWITGGTLPLCMAQIRSNSVDTPGHHKTFVYFILPCIVVSSLLYSILFLCSNIVFCPSISQRRFIDTFAINYLQTSPVIVQHVSNTYRVCSTRLSVKHSSYNRPCKFKCTNIFYRLLIEYYKYFQLVMEF